MSEAVSMTRDELSRRARMRRRIRAFLAKSYMNIISLVLLTLSAFFFLHVQKDREATLANHPELFADNDLVTVIKVIDGDEVRIQNASGSTRLRLLGIQSFDASAKDLLLAEYGKIAVDYLEAEAVSKTAKLRIAPKAIDDEGRLLGSLILKDSGDDLAERMVENGITLVYEKYPFAQMESFLDSQQAAKNEKVGLWMSDRVRVRAESMSRLWRKERAGH